MKFDGALVIGQVEKRFGDAARIEVGAWTYTNAFPSLVETLLQRLAEPRVHGDDGAYAMAEGRVLGARRR